MPWVYIICFALIAAGLLTLFGVRPGDFIDALFRSQRKSATLTDELNVLMGTPAKGFFNQDFELKQILKGTGRADRYEAVKRLTLILFAVGGALALLIGNVYMVPILGIGFSLAPIWYLRSTAASYQELRDRQQEEVNAFPMFFAFDQRQFAEGMRRLGLRPSDMNQVYAIAGTGGFYRKSDAPKLHEMFARHRKELDEAIAADKAGDNFIYEMFLTELSNHEYGYTGDVQDTLDALGITPQYMEAMPQLKAGLDLACQKVMQNDCF